MCSSDLDLVRGLANSSVSEKQGTYGRWYALKGNHEEMMVMALSGHDPEFWRDNGGAETVKSYAGNTRAMERDALWLASLPTMLTTEHYCFVHAGVSPRYPLDAQPDEVRMWIRGWEKDDHDFGRHIVYGHTPHMKGPKLLTNSTGLDTGACYGGKLTIGVFDPTRAASPVEIMQVP